MNPTAPLAVHVRAVTKTFGTGETAVRALKGVDFDARQGELLMIVGPSGCGKTTLLSVIAGTLDIDGGEINVFGSALHALRPRHVTEFRKRHVGFIFQQFNLVGRLALMTNVLTGLAADMPLWRAVLLRFTELERARALDALQAVGLLEQAWQPGTKHLPSHVDCHDDSKQDQKPF